MLGSPCLLERADLGRDDDAGGLQWPDPPLVWSVADRNQPRRLGGDDLDKRVVLRQGPGQQADAELPRRPGSRARLPHPIRARGGTEAKHPKCPGGGDRCGKPTGAHACHRGCHHGNGQAELLGEPGAQLLLLRSRPTMP